MCDFHYGLMPRDNLHPAFWLHPMTAKDRVKVTKHRICFMGSSDAFMSGGTC